MNKALIAKYDKPGPRYTSYPTVPQWSLNQISKKQWFTSFLSNDVKSKNTSLYIHLPYCESLCTFCGCHKRITKNHSVEKPYLDALIQEWELYKNEIDYDLKIKELHFGGGTPTFFKPDHLIFLLESLFGQSKVNPQEIALSFEAHPNNTSKTHLLKLYEFGFRRLSIGVQGYDPKVQKAINRIQPFEQVKKVHQLAREIGYDSISHDLVYGLPKQSTDGILDSIQKTLDLKPDRIALYGYAHVPWIKGNGQRGFDENDIPSGKTKRELYDKAKEVLLKSGYLEIGMDHFALENDELYIAYKNQNLHRNFMGYTTQNTDLLIGLGASAISDSGKAYAQNEKNVEKYISSINDNIIPLTKGHVLSLIDIGIRKNIMDLMCQFETKLHLDSTFKEINFKIKASLEEMVDDDLVTVKNNTISVTDKGILFVRNCCMAFDQYYAKSTIKNKYSRTI